MKREVNTELSRELSLFQITMMGVGMMIGAGVFVATGIGIGEAGTGGLLLAFTLNGLLAFMSVMIYAELSSAIPKAGGGYSYVNESIGGFTGFFAGWVSWFAHAVAGSLYAITFSKYTLHFILTLIHNPFLENNLILIEKILAVLVALIFIYINYLGVSETGNIGSTIAIGQTLVLGLIGIAGIYIAFRNPSRLMNFNPFLDKGWDKVLMMMGFSLVGFEGYEVIANTAEEVKHAKKNVPKAIFFAVIIVVTTYLLVAFAAVVAIDVSGLSVSDWFKEHGATGFAEAIGQLFPYGNFFVVFAAIFASTSALNATIYSSTRVSFALGRDHYLPHVFSHISEKNRIPDMALLFSGIIIVAIAALFPVEVVVAGTSLFFIILFSLVAMASIRIRKERGNELKYGFLMPFFPAIPVISILFQFSIALHLFEMGSLAYIIAGGWIVLGVIFYIFLSPKAAEKVKKEYILKKAENESGRHQILVSVANISTAPVLINYAEKIAKKQNSKIIISNIVSVPLQTPYYAAEKFIANPKAIVEKTSKLVHESISVESVLRYGHNIARSIIGSVKEKQVDLLILGWKGRERRDYFSLGSTLDPVIERAPCDILVIKTDNRESENRVKKILFPTRGKSPNCKLAINIIEAISLFSDTETTILHIENKKSNGLSLLNWENALKSCLNKLEYTLKNIKSENIIDSIVKESEKFDIIVLGASSENILHKMLFGSTTEKIAKRCRKTVLLVKKNSGLVSWFRRWISQ